MNELDEPHNIQNLDTLLRSHFTAISQMTISDELHQMQLPTVLDNLQTLYVDELLLTNSMVKIEYSFEAGLLSQWRGYGDDAGYAICV